MKPKKKLLTLVLPLPLPSSNRILVMNRFSRKKLRDLTDLLVSISLRTATDTSIAKTYGLNTSRMHWLRQEYWRMIGMKYLGESQQNNINVKRAKKKP